MRTLVVLCTFCAACLPTPGCDDQDYMEPVYQDLAVQLDLTPCPAMCDGVCTNLHEPKNCGACGVTCAAGSKCVDTSGGVAQCTCDRDGGAPGCGFALDPICSPKGHCGCGSESEVCEPNRSSQCKNGQCVCGENEVCGPLSDHCDPFKTPSCRCGLEASCDSHKSNRCAGNSCKCGQHAACGPTSSCCGADIGGSTCCDNAKYCCLDGCCDHPCLVFGFCAQ